MSKKDKIGTGSIVKRNDELLFSKMDEEIVMLSVENSEYYGMNSIGARIWEIIEQPVRVEDLISVLLKEYDVDQHECENDVLLYLNELEQKNVIIFT